MSNTSKKVCVMLTLVTAEVKSCFHNDIQSKIRFVRIGLFDMKINMGREIIIFYSENNGLSNAVRQCLFLKQFVLGKESTKIWFTETKIRPTGKICIPRQDSLEKQIREMIEWL